MDTRHFDPEAPEMMDRPQADPLLLETQLRHLRQINRYFGGHDAYERVYHQLNPREESWTILDLCTGSADHPQYLFQRHPHLRGIAADFQSKTLQHARQRLSHSPIRFIQADALQLPFQDRSIDLVLCSLALHHFSEGQAVRALQEMRRVARRGAAVIDLVRSPAAYASIWLLTTLWMRDPYTVHDGRASVRAAFRPEELQALTHQAGWPGAWHLSLPWFRQAVGFHYGNSA